MGKEIERKFLVSPCALEHLKDGVLYKQGYLSSVPQRTVRIRICNGKGYITVKGIAKGAVRSEYEYEIPVDDANEMLDTLCEKPIIEKIRFIYNFKGFTWEVDKFLGENEGLVTAEIELLHESECFEKPYWITEEVTHEPRYFNSNLIKFPYKYWLQE
jgi:CYTH domain-containing protein